MKRALFLIITVMSCLIMTSGVYADPPSNDNCIDADDAGTLVSGSPVQLTGTTVDATQDCANSTNSEVWIKFTLAECMDVSIDYCNDPSNVTEVVYTLYGGCPCDNGVYFNYSEVCSSSYNYSYNWIGLDAGTYYYSIVQPHHGAGAYTINVTGVDCPDAPANDNCSDAIAIGEVTDYSFTTRSATHDGGGTCITSGGNVWFEYTASTNFTARISLGGSQFNTMMAVYDGVDCSRLPARLGCTTADYLDIPVVSGQSYLIEIGGEGDVEGNGLLNIGEAPVTPANDDCVNADAAGTLQDGVTVQLTGETEGATTDCSNHHTPEVWVSFILETCMNVTIDFCDDINTVRNPSVYVYGACPCAQMDHYDSQVSCSLGTNESYTWTNLEAGVYYYPIFDNGNPYTVNITGNTCAPILGACCMNDGMSCTDSTTEDYCLNTLRGTWMGDGSTCGTYDDEDGWSGCSQPAVGACCMNDGMNCTDSTTEDYCLNTLRGTWMGDGSSCGTYDHEGGWSGCNGQVLVGACCVDDGMNCTDSTTEDYCLNTLRGIWKGDSSSCGTYDDEDGWSGCIEPETGACCYGDGTSCLGELTEVQCVDNYNGTWMGVDTDCADNDGNRIADICEQPDAYDYLPGDANMSTGNWPPSTIGGDVTYLVNYFRGITAPCMLDGFYASADANGSCSVTGADVTKLVSYFRGMDDLNYCPDYPTTWPPLPDTAPDGWPNCASPVLSK